MPVHFKNNLMGHISLFTLNVNLPLINVTFCTLYAFGVLFSVVGVASKYCAQNDV